MTELMLALTLGAILTAVAAPSFADMLRRNRFNAAIRTMVSDLRSARAEAVATGWQYRLIGYDTDATGARSNQYRVFARRSGAVSWPAEEAQPFQNASSLALPWVNLTGQYPGVELDAGSTQFDLTFDSRGSAPGAGTTFSPLTFTGPDDLQGRITVSTVGVIRIE